LVAETPIPTETISTLNVSAATGSGLVELKAAILKQFQSDSGTSRGVVETTRARTRDALVTAAKSLENAAFTVATDGGDELVAMDLRAAVESLDIITGSDVTEETLDRVFSRFCIGK
jgi:tRNA modification GTPase